MGYLIVSSFGVTLFQGGINASGHYPEFIGSSNMISVLPKFIADITIEENETGGNGSLHSFYISPNSVDLITLKTI